MPIIDVAMDVVHWSLDPVVGDEEHVHILSFTSGSLQVAADLTREAMHDTAYTIEEALDRLEDVPMEWSPMAAIEGPFAMTYRLAYAGLQATAPYWAHTRAIGYWTLIFDDDDMSQAVLAIRHSDIGALLYQLQAVLVATDDALLAQNMVSEDILAAAHRLDHLDPSASVRYLSTVAKARRAHPMADPSLAIVLGTLHEFAPPSVEDNRDIPPPTRR